MNDTRLKPSSGHSRSYLPGLIEFKLATEPWELSAYYQLRESVFCEEQEIFAESDVDATDRHALPIVAIVHTAGIPDRVVGTVRIYEDRDEAGHWYGGRLTTAPDLRRAVQVGRGLIRTAVTAAHALGCKRFLAYVQEANERYFQRYRFETLRYVEKFGVRHALMEADLRAYPPRDPIGLFKRSPDRSALLVGTYSD